MIYFDCNLKFSSYLHFLSSFSLPFFLPSLSSSYILLYTCLSYSSSLFHMVIPRLLLLSSFLFGVYPSSPFLCLFFFSFLSSSSFIPSPFIFPSSFPFSFNTFPHSFFLLFSFNFFLHLPSSSLIPPSPPFILPSSVSL